MPIKPIIEPVLTLGKTLLLVEIKAVHERIEKTKGEFEKTDKISHYNYTVVALERKFEKISIKIDEPRPLFDDEVPNNVYVQFENLTITPYVSNGWIQLSAKADKCVVIKGA